MIKGADGLVQIKRNQRRFPPDKLIKLKEAVKIIKRDCNISNKACGKNCTAQSMKKHVCVENFSQCDSLGKGGEGVNVFDGCENVCVCVCVCESKCEAGAEKKKPDSVTFNIKIATQVPRM